MAARWKCFGCAVIAILITGTQSSERAHNGLETDILVSDRKSLKKILYKDSSNNAQSLIPNPAAIQQGNNIYIKPKIIIDSSISYNKKGYNPINRQAFSLASKVPNEGTKVMISKPSVIIPTDIDGDIKILPPRIPYQPQIQIPMENICVSMGCARDIIPYFPHLPRFPIMVEKPIRPLVVPKPPELPPIILPKLPIQVTVQRPIIPILNQQVIVRSICPPSLKCITTEKDFPSFTDGLTGIFQKFKSILTISSKIDFNNIFISDEQISSSNLPISFPALCAQGIISERVVPNIIKNNDIKIFMSPSVSPSQLENFNIK